MQVIHNMSTHNSSHTSHESDRNYPFKKSFEPVKYKKAPNAPRRFKSSYMFFSTAKHKEIREERAGKGENPKSLSTTEVAKMVSQAWKDLSEEEREKWEEKGRKDKARYEMEKAMYSGPWKVPVNGKREKDPNRPKRPMSAFLSYSNKNRAAVKEIHKNAKTADVSRILAQMWKEASPEEKKDFIDEEFKLRQEYKTAIAEWKEKTEKDFNEKREARESEAMKLVLEGKLPPDPYPLTSATSLPTGTEYNTQMAEDTFDTATDIHRQSYQHHASVAGFGPLCAGFPVPEASASLPSAELQPAFDPIAKNSNPSSAYMYSAYAQPPYHGYPTTMYPVYSTQQFPPPSGNSGAPAALGDSSQQYGFSRYYQFDPNSPYRHPPYS